MSYSGVGNITAERADRFDGKAWRAILVTRHAFAGGRPFAKTEESFRIAGRTIGKAPRFDEGKALLDPRPPGHTAENLALARLKPAIDVSHECIVYLMRWDGGADGIDMRGCHGVLNADVCAVAVGAMSGQRRLFCHALR